MSQLQLQLLFMKRPAGTFPPDFSFDMLTGFKTIGEG